MDGIRARSVNEPIDVHLERRGRSLPEINHNHAIEDGRTYHFLGDDPRGIRSGDASTGLQDERREPMFSPLEDFFHFIDSAVVAHESDDGPGRSIPHRQPHDNFAEALGMFPSLFGQVRAARLSLFLVCPVCLPVCLFFALFV